MCLKATKHQDWKAFAAEGTNLLFYLMFFLPSKIILIIIIFFLLPFHVIWFVLI